MSLDDTLSSMLDAMDAGNYWDTEAYAQQALDYVSNSDNRVNEQIDRGELVIRLSSIISLAKEEHDKARMKDRAKNDLIDRIVNFRG